MSFPNRQHWTCSIVTAESPKGPSAREFRQETVPNIQRAPPQRAPGPVEPFPWGPDGGSAAEAGAGAAFRSARPWRCPGAPHCSKDCFALGSFFSFLSPQRTSFCVFADFHISTLRQSSVFHVEICFFSISMGDAAHLYDCALMSFSVT